MAKLADLPRRMVSGRRYGASGQPLKYYHHGDGSNLIKRSGRFTDYRERRSPEEKTMAKARNISGMLATVSAGNIQWVPQNERSYVIAHCSQLVRTVEKLIFGHQSNFNHFYQKLIGSLKNPKFEITVRFQVVASGVVPQRKDVGTFIKLVAQGDEFILPNSFLKDCREAFLPPLPR